MPRTPQLRFIRRLAAEHSAAERLQMPVDEYRTMRDAAVSDPAGISRRQLLRRVGAFGLGAVALAASGVRNSPPAKGLSSGAKPRVVVVGAGIAGLTAALTLQDGGVPAAVYEANPERIGGRMYSQGGPAHPGYWAGNQVSEWGGELIDTDHHAIRNLCARFQLPLTAVKDVYGRQAQSILWFDGGYYSYAQASADFKPVLEAVRNDLRRAGGSSPDWRKHSQAAAELDRMSVRDWIESRVPGGSASRLGAFLDVGYTLEEGADTAEQSAYNLLGLLSEQADPRRFELWGASDECFHIAGGNDQLPRVIAEALPAGAIALGHTLVAVAANSDGTQNLTFAVSGGGLRTVVADQTILTVPLGVLQSDVDLSKAGLDARMSGALKNKAMGDCAKLNMQFDARPWTGDGPWPGASNGEMFTDLPLQQLWDVTRGQAGSCGILVQYGAGSQADALNPPSAFTDASCEHTARRVREVLAQAEDFVPGVVAAWNGKATLSAWRLNPYSRGAYSYWPVGYVTAYAGYEGVAQGGVRFAGEHTSYDSQGYMNGGCESGARAAKEILAAL